MSRSHNAHSRNDDNHHSLPDYHPFQDSPNHNRNSNTKNNEEEEDNIPYIVKQKHGYFSVLFSLVQTIILISMMYSCKVAPLALNPMLGPYPDALSYWGGKNSYLILENQENYRLLSPILLHAGVVHLLGNIAVQLDTGAFFEREWGSFQWLIIYVMSAIGSSAWSTIFMPGSISVGSSGSVMGLFGAKLAEVVVRYCDKIKTMQHKIAQEVRMEQCRSVTCSVIIVALFSFIPFVDWAAHMGGLVAGFCVGMFIFAFRVRKKLMLMFWACLGLFLSILFYSTSLEYMYNEVEPVEELRDVCEYYTQYYEDYVCYCQFLDED